MITPGVPLRISKGSSKTEETKVNGGLAISIGRSFISAAISQQRGHNGVDTYSVPAGGNAAVFSSWGTAGPVRLVSASFLDPGAGLGIPSWENQSRSRFQPGLNHRHTDHLPGALASTSGRQGVHQINQEPHQALSEPLAYPPPIPQTRSQGSK